MYSDIYFKSINSIIKENIETKGCTLKKNSIALGIRWQS